MSSNSRPMPRLFLIRHGMDTTLFTYLRSYFYKGKLNGLWMGQLDLLLTNYLASDRSTYAGDTLVFWSLLKSSSWKGLQTGRTDIPLTARGQKNSLFPLLSAHRIFRRRANQRESSDIGWGRKFVSIFLCFSQSFRPDFQRSLIPRIFAPSLSPRVNAPIGLFISCLNMSRLPTTSWRKTLASGTMVRILSSVFSNVNASRTGDYEGLLSHEIKERQPGWSIWKDGSVFISFTAD